MTQNATAYFNVVEQGRANRASEAETHRKNVAAEQHNINVLSETIRHNQALEAVESFRAFETARHNLESESLGRGNLSLDWSRLSETARANRAAEAELFRSHRAQETELLRSHLVSEGISAVQAWASHRSATASMRAADARYLQAEASKRQARTAEKRNTWEKEAQKHRTIQGYMTSGAQVYNSFTNAKNARSNAKNANTNRLKAGADILMSVGKMFILSGF